MVAQLAAWRFSRSVKSNKNVTIYQKDTQTQRSNTSTVGIKEMEVFDMEQELQELKAVLASTSEQLRKMNDIILTNDVGKAQRNQSANPIIFCAGSGQACFEPVIITISCHIHSALHETPDAGNIPSCTAA